MHLEVHVSVLLKNINTVLMDWLIYISLYLTDIICSIQACQLYCEYLHIFKRLCNFATLHFLWTSGYFSTNYSNDTLTLGIIELWLVISRLLLYKYAKQKLVWEMINGSFLNGFVFNFIFVVVWWCPLWCVVLILSVYFVFMLIFR